MGAMSNKVKVLVVDDSAFSRQTIKKILESDTDIEVIEIASNGIEAMKKVLKLKPDLITLDFDMPEMDGFGFLRWLMQQIPIPVIMVSSYSDSKTVFKALELGAVDFIAKPSRRATVELRNIEKDLLAKVRGTRGLNMSVLNKNLELLRQRKESTELQPAKGGMDVVAVGASTGGPSALQIILAEMPPDFPSGIVVAQHMPRGFTKTLAERLDEICKVNVREAENGAEVEKGKALICPGGSHMTLKRRGGKVCVSLKRSTFKDKYTPSIDTMMVSAAEQCGENAMGVILTGMGNDGKEGMLEIKSRGGYTIAESEETSVVFGMPAEAIKAKAAVKVLPLQGIAREIIKVAGGKRS
jgi:two-component system chemotaxis response regulator CheB